VIDELVGDPLPRLRDQDDKKAQLLAQSRSLS